LLLSKDLLTHFLDPGFAGTEAKDAPYAVTGENATHASFWCDLSP